jgi:hypothetical protein
MNGEGLALKIQIGTREFDGRLPLLPHRYAIWNAFDEVTTAATVRRRLTDDQLSERLGLDLDQLEELRKNDELGSRVEAARGLELSEDGAVQSVEFDPDLLNVEDVGALALASIGLVWDDEPLQIEAPVVKNGRVSRRVFLVPGQTSQLLRVLDRDLVVFGEHVGDALGARGLTDPRELYRSGRKIREEIVLSIPKTSEVEEAAGNFGARAETFTGSSSSLV